MYTTELNTARKDVKTCLKIWTEILTEVFSGQIEVIYAKGSAIKPWESAIDYVPIMSDVDIHVQFVNTNSKDPIRSLPLEKALGLSEKYETLFSRRRPDPIHLPRTQIVSLNRLVHDPSFIFPRVEDIVLLYGWYDPHEEVPADSIRKIDKEKVLSDILYLEMVTESVFDRTGLDFWSMLRRINWRISPAPVRLLTQILSISPYEIWNWSRTKIVRELINQDFPLLAQSYQDYYISGWKLFVSDFLESHYYRELFSHGFTILTSIKSILKSF